MFLEEQTNFWRKVWGSVPQGVLWYVKFGEECKKSNIPTKHRFKLQIVWRWTPTRCRWIHQSLLVAGSKESGGNYKLLEHGSNLWVKLQHPCSKHQKYVGGSRQQIVWNQSNLWIELHIWWSYYQNDELSPNFMGSIPKFNQMGTNSQFDIQVH